LSVSLEVHQTLRRLHRFFEGVLGIGERVERTLFVIDAETGRPVFPAPPGVFDEGSISLHAPEDEPGALMVLGRAVEIDPLRDAACDRWLMHHGKARWARWAALEIESVKDVGTVLGGEEAQVANPLRGVEGALCKWVNKEHEFAMRRACARSTGMAPASALLVAVDPYGLDVRAHFGAVRVEFEGVALDEGAARRAVEGALGL
jgi:hypothetical protein